VGDYNASTSTIFGAWLTSGFSSSSSGASWGFSLISLRKHSRYDTGGQVDVDDEEYVCQVPEWAKEG